LSIDAKAKRLSRDSIKPKGLDQVPPDPALSA